MSSCYRFIVFSFSRTGAFARRWLRPWLNKKAQVSVVFDLYIFNQIKLKINNKKENKEMIKKMVKFVKWLFKEARTIESHHDSHPYSHYQISQRALRDRRA